MIGVYGAVILIVVIILIMPGILCAKKNFDT